MTTPGPVPKRDAERRRVNDPANGPADFFNIDEVAKDAQVDSLPWKIAQPVVVPEFDGAWDEPASDDAWHPLAKQWYDSLSYSGQSIFYEPSDWMLAAVVAEAISRELKPQPLVVGKGEDATVEMISQPIKGASLSAIIKAMGSLMVSEGDRRRMRLELQRRAHEGGAVEGDAEVISMADRRRELLA